MTSNNTSKSRSGSNSNRTQQKGDLLFLEWSADQQGVNPDARLHVAREVARRKRDLRKQGSSSKASQSLTSKNVPGKFVLRPRPPASSQSPESRAQHEKPSYGELALSNLSVTDSALRDFWVETTDSLDDSRERFAQITPQSTSIEAIESKSWKTDDCSYNLATPNSSTSIVYIEESQSRHFPPHHRGGRAFSESSTLSSSGTFFSDIEDEAQQKIDRAAAIGWSPDSSVSNDTMQAIVFSANRVAGACIDPFGCIPITLDASVQTFLQYFHRYTIGSSHTAPLELLPPRLRRHPRRNLMQTIILESLFEERHLYSILSLAAARMQRFSSDQSIYDSNAEFFMHQAIKRLRTHLKSCKSGTDIDTQTMYDIHWLAACEAYRGKFAAAETHLRAIAQLVRLLDKSNALDQQLLESICMLDTSISTQTGTIPLIAWPWESSPPVHQMAHINQYVNQVACSGEDQSLPSTPSYLSTSDVLPPPDSTIPLSSTTLNIHLSMGKKFEELLESSFLTPKLRDVMENLIQSITLAKYVLVSPLVTPQETELLCRSLLGNLHLLLSMRYDGVLSSDASTLISGPLAEAIRLSLVIVLCYVRTRWSKDTAKLNARRLCSTLHRCIALTQDSANDFGLDTQDHSSRLQRKIIDELLLWVFMTGASAAERGSDLEAWYIDGCVKTAARLRLYSLAELEQHVSQYVYLSIIHQQSLQMVEQILRGKSSNQSGFQNLGWRDQYQMLIPVLDSIRNATVAFDQYHRFGIGTPELQDLIQARETIQHRLSISIFDQDLPGPEDSVYEACRLSALIFCDLVLSASSPQVTAVSIALSNKLRWILDCCTLHDCWRSHGDLLQWAVFLGTIANASTTDRQWYVNKLQVYSVPYFEGWEDVKTMLCNYLFSEYICDKPGRNLWLEACKGTMG
jgi:hypothetical protein